MNIIINERLQTIDKFRNDLFYYLTSGANAVYKGSNSCPAPDGPYKGIIMINCVAQDPKFREFSKRISLINFSLGAILDITSTVVNKLEAEI